MQDPDLDQLRAIQALWQQFPGSQPNGTGPTGLLPGDSRGWTDQQNKNTWALNKIRELQGQGPMAVRAGRDLGGMPPDLSQDPAWYQQIHRANPTMNVNPGAMAGLQSAVPGRKSGAGV